VIINREWAMPDRWTFKIKPIADLLTRYVGDGKRWIDPFAGENSPAEFKNDLNPSSNADSHMKAIDYLKTLKGKYTGVLFDPPYSLRQVKECYESIGIPVTAYDSNYAGQWIFEKAELSRLIKIGGMAISFGWNTSGIGKLNGFDIIEILLVPHGGAHNDTIVTVERKIQDSF
jgi:hypothetical protein